MFLSSLLCGLLPALKAVRQDLNTALKTEEHQTPRTWNLRAVLVAGQLATSIVLLSVGFLFLHNLLRAASMHPGFDVDRTVWAYMRLVPEQYSHKNDMRQVALVRSALDQLRALPGVESAAITRRIPLNDSCINGTSVKTDLSATPVPVQYACNEVGPDYFRTIGIPILRGREFTSSDGIGAQPAVIINETFARTVFGNRNPVGHRVITTFSGRRSALVIGVAKDSRYFTLSEKQRPALYEDFFAGSEPINLSFMVRTKSSPTALIRPVTDLLHRLDPSAAIETKPMKGALGLALLPSQVSAVVLGTMGFAALLLAVIGLYGLLLYSVSRRTREIGLRIALGATRTNVLQLVFRQSLILVGSGAFVGLVLALFATQPLAMFLVPGVRPFDPGMFFAAVGILVVTALLAMLAPALRALRIEPIIALRYE